jgi:hypothetical protein
MFTNGFNAVRERVVYPSVAFRINSGWWQKYELFRASEQINRELYIVYF